MELLVVIPISIHPFFAEVSKGDGVQQIPPIIGDVKALTRETSRNRAREALDTFMLVWVPLIS